MGYIANIFSFKYVNILLVITLSLFFLSACNNNKDKGNNRHTEKQEISPLGEGQSVNDLYPTPASKDTSDTNNTTQPPVKTVELPIVNQSELLLDPQNIIVNLDFHGKQPTNATCQVVILSAQVSASMAGISSARPFNADEFNITTNATLSKLNLNDTFIANSVVVYKNNDEALMKDDSGQIFMSLNQSNLSQSFNFTTTAQAGGSISGNGYYVFAMCDDLYADIGNQQSLQNQSSQTAGTGNVSTINITAVQPSSVSMVTPFKLLQEKLIILADPLPSAPQSCVAFTIAVDNANLTAYNANRTTFADIFNQTPHKQIQHLLLNGQFLNGTVVSIGDVDIYTAPNGVKYLQADISTLPAILDATKTYYPVLECGDKDYSDYTNITPHLSTAISLLNRASTLEPITHDILNIVELHMVEPIKRIINKPMAPKSPSILTFNLNFPQGQVPTDSCSAIVVQAPKSGYATSHQQIGFYATTASQFSSSLHAGSQYLGGTLVYVSTVSVYNDDTGTKYVQINTANLTNFDTNTYSYYPAFVCLDANSTGLYSNYGTVSAFSSSGGGFDPVSIDFNSPPRRTTIQPQANPSSALFTANLTFSGTTIPSKSCEYIIISTTHGSAYNVSSVAQDFYSKSLSQLQILGRGTSFLGGTIDYINSNETMLQDPKGQIYLSANIAGADINAKDYYPIIVCDTTYSDFLNVTKFTSADGHNVDPLSVALLLPTLSIQPGDDVVFGSNARNASTTLEAFNDSDSKYNFVLDLGNMPDPQNASCQYAASIDYEGALSRGEALQFPVTQDDFASLYPGGHFGNSEPNGVLAVVKNPVLHHVTSNTNIGTGTGYYLGIRINIAKPVHVYLNVALCELAGNNTYPGYANSSNTTSYNHDTVQELRFNVTYDTMAQTAIFYKDFHLSMNDHPIELRTKLVPDSTLDKQILKEAMQNDTCGQNKNGPQTLIAMNHTNTQNFKQVSADFAGYLDWRAGPLNGFARQGGSISSLIMRNFTMKTDYKDIYVYASVLDSSITGFFGLDPNYNNPQAAAQKFNFGLDNSSVDVFYVLACDMGNGHKFKTDLTRIQPGHFVTNGTQLEFQPRPYVIPITTTN